MTLPEETRRALRAFGTEYDRALEQRRLLGAQKYGDEKFLTVDTIDEAMQELIDLGNYARYTYIKLRALQEKLKGIVE